MYHLTRNQQQFLRRNHSRLILSFCVALALSGGGGLVSAEKATYDYVNPWRIREATKGDSIEVKWMSGGDGKLQAGTDKTSEVKVHALWTYGNPEVYVKGKKITIGDNYTDEKGNPIPTANWGGKISIGGDTTESVTMEGFRTSGEGADTTIQGSSVSMGSLDNWGSTVTVKADKDFKVVKDGNFPTIGLTSGGTISITAGSMEAGGLNVTGNYDGTESKADFHISGTSGIHFHDGLAANTNGNILIDSQKIQVDDHSRDGYSIYTTDSTISMGNNGAQITLNGQLCNAGSKVTLKGKSIFINAAQPDSTDGSYNLALRTTNENKSATVIGDENTDTVHINGKTNVSSTGSSLKIQGRNIEMSYGKGIALSGSGGNVYIGGMKTENLTIWGQVLNRSSENMKLSGKHITIDSTGYDGSELKQYYPFSQSLVTGENSIDAGDENTKTISISGGVNARKGAINVQGKYIHIGASNYFNKHLVSKDLKDGFIANAAAGEINIGKEDSDVVRLVGGQLLAGGANINVQGKNIFITGDDNWAGYTLGGHLNIGTGDNHFVQIQGGVHTQGGGAVIQGKRIAVSSDNKSRYALDGIGGDITVGGDTAQSINVDGGIHTQKCKITLTGKDISVSKGKQENAIYTDGGIVSITATGGDEAHISGPVKNKYGNIDISFTGRSNHLDSQIITEETSLGTNISLTDKASWNPVNDKSNFTTYRGNDGIIHLDNDTHQTVIVSNFNDKGTWIHEDIYGSGNTGNDTIYIDKSYTGNTHFWLVNRENTDKGVKGTILASALKKDSLQAESSGGSVALMAAMPMAVSAADPIADFKANHFTASGMSKLYFKTYGLDTKDSAEEYTRDLYITDVTSHSTNEHGQHTPTVSAALAGSSLMYYTWRTENDKMLQRVGDLRENEGEETGIWARIRGSRIGRDGYRSFKNQYKVYELGYDKKTADNDRLKSFSGVAFSYLDGKGEYPGGQGTNQAVSAALYHTDIHKSGHYLDMVFRLRHLNERFHVRNTVDTDIGPITEDSHGSMNTTGVSFSAEYGRKKFIGRQWYIEPQTQWTLGYLGRNHYDMDNGTRVEQPGITSFVGRVGFNLGRQINKDSIVYLKANVSHEFGGHSPLHLYAGDENMSFTDTFDDTWFEYGAGFAVKLNEGVSLYGDFEKSAGGRFYKDWQWNAGIRYSF